MTTDIDIQQLKDLIIAGQQTNQQQLNEIKIEIAEIKTELNGVKTQLSDIKTDQRGQNNRFFGLLLFFLTVAIGIATKLAKLY